MSYLDAKLNKNIDLHKSFGQKEGDMIASFDL